MIDVVVADAWEKVRELMRIELGERTFELWFARCRNVLTSAKLFDVLDETLMTIVMCLRD